VLIPLAFPLLHSHLSLFYLFTFLQIRDYFFIMEGEGKGREVKGKKKGGKERERKGKGKGMEVALQICTVLCMNEPGSTKKKLCNWPFFMKKRVRKKA
jgi:hypothetical protein